MKTRNSNPFHRHAPFVAVLVGGPLLLTESSQAANGSWAGTTSSAWLTATNWTGSVIPGSQSVTTNTDIATFNVATQPTVGLNLNFSGNTYYLGALDYTNATARNIGNSSATGGVLLLNGATVNSVANTIIRNSSTGLLTLQATQAGTMGIALGNTTNNIIQITGTGGITISSIISGSGKNLTLQGGGTGVLTLSGANTYSGNTTISTGTLSVAASNNLGAAASNLVFDGGTLQITGTGLTAFSTIGHAVSFNAAKTVGLDINNAANSFTVDQVLNQTTGGFTKTGTGTAVLNQTNTYTGATTISAGTLSVGAAANLGNSASNLVFDGGTLQITGTGLTAFSTIGHSVSFNAGKNVGLDINNSANTFDVDQVLNQTTGGFTKAGVGTVTLSQANTYTGNTTLTGGTLNVTGSITGNTTSSLLAVGTTAASTVVNVSGNVTVFNMTGAAVAGSNAVYNQTAGTVTTSQTAGFSQFMAGNATAYGYFNLTGGSFTTGTGNFSVQTNGTAAAYVGGTGVLNINASNNNTIAFNAGIGSLTVGPGGTVSRTNGSGALYLFTNQNSTGILNVAGGNIDLGSGLFRAGNGSAATFTGMNGFINLAGGTLTMGSVLTNNGNSANNLYANYAGGTLKASANLTNPVTSGTGVTTVSTLFGAIDNPGTSSDFGGGLTVDTNGFAVSYGNALRGATGDGVTQSAMTITGGSGYTGAPTVTFTGGTLTANGTPASGYAVVSGGVVTGIVITSPGTYTSAPTVTLTGGGGTGASISLGSLTANAADTGVIKTGAGTLTLSGANTFVGGVKVTSGTLTLSNAAGAGTGTISFDTGGSTSATVQTSGALTVANPILVASGSTGTNLLGNSTGNTTVFSGAITANDNLTISSNFAAVSVTVFGAGATVASGKTITLQNTSTGTVAVSGGGIVSGSGGLTTAGAGVGSINMAGAHTYSGGFTLGGSSTVTFQSSSAGSAGSPTSGPLGTGTATLGTGTIRSTTSADTTLHNALTLAGNLTTPTLTGEKSLIFTGPATLTGTRTFNVNLGTTDATKSLTFSGVIDDGGNGYGITKSGTGIMTLGGANTYTGATTISDGTLSVSSVVVSGGSSGLGNATSAVTLGSSGAQGILSYTGSSGTYTRGFTIGGSGGGRLNVSSSGQTLTVDTGAVTGSGQFSVGGAGDTSISANLTHTGGLTKTDSGTLTITGTGNTYTGNTDVNQGKLVINGNVSTSTLTTVSSGATLGGSGTVGALTINSGAFVTPGNSPGVLTVNGNYTQAGQYTAELGGTVAGADYDQIDVTGLVDISGGSLVTLFSGSYTLNDMLFILRNDGADTVTGTYSGFAQGDVVASYGGFDWQISYMADSTGNTFTGGNDIALMAVPEPNIAALLGGFGLLSLLRRRR